METRTVILRASWLPTWERLSDAEVGAMCRAFLRHAAGEDVDPATLPGRYAPGMYAVHLLQLDADRAAYTATCDRRAAAGRKGGRPRKGIEDEPEEEAPVPAKAKPRKPAMSEAEQKELFERFWTVAGDASQSPAGAWSWWRKAIHSEARASELTIAAERAQALQDARGLARYNIIGWLRKQGWKAEACTDEGAFRAELARARASSGRRAVPAGSTENALAALLGAEPEPVEALTIEEGRHAD